MGMSRMAAGYYYRPKTCYDETSYEDLRPEINLKWQKNKVKSLGTWLSIDPEATVLLNLTKKLETVRNIQVTGNIAD